MASRRGARTELMTGDRRIRSTQHNSRDVPQFAPNFTVYVLPPDVVCLYSEDRKFLLHGELYCALASAIRRGREDLSRDRSRAEQDFPSDKVHEAVKRLVDRRYVVPASPSSAGAVAAYWASLGLSPDTAEQNLRNCRVRIQSIDVQGAAELGGALGGLGVRVVKRSPDLTVTLASDYLDNRLAELNRQHLSDRTPWLLVQPSGIFPWWGRYSAQETARVGRVLPLACSGTEKSRGCSTANRPAASPSRRSPGTSSDKAASSSPPSRSRKRSPPTFAPI